MAAGTGIGLAVASGGTVVTTPTTTVPVATSPHGPSTPSKGQALRGQITAETGSSWTVVNPKGRSFTVTISPTTKFGTSAVPATESQFTVGSSVMVRGVHSGNAVTAVRVQVPRSPTNTPSGA
jgi:hypothetical protein